MYSRAGQLQSTGRQHHSLSTRLWVACVYTYIEKRWGGGWIDKKAVIYKQYVTLKVRLNDRVVVLIEVDKRERMISLHCAAFKVVSYSF